MTLTLVKRPRCEAENVYGHKCGEDPGHFPATPHKCGLAEEGDEWAREDEEACGGWVNEE